MQLKHTIAILLVMAALGFVGEMDYQDELDHERRVAGKPYTQ